MFRSIFADLFATQLSVFNPIRHLYLYVAAFSLSLSFCRVINTAKQDGETINKVWVELVVTFTGPCKTLIYCLFGFSCASLFLQ